MSQLYCGDCQNYLMGSDGQCHDCGCGWKQPVETYEKENTELEAEVARLQKENAELKENRDRLVVAIHCLASNFENILGVLANDEEALTKAKGDIAHAMKVAKENRG